MTYRSTGRLSPTARAWALVTRRARRIRKPRKGEEWAAAIVTALVLIALVAELVRAVAGFLLATWWAIPAVVIATVLASAGYGRVRMLSARAAAARLATLRYTLADLDQMTPGAFEDAIRDLMIRDGIPARRVGGRGDLAADVIGRHLPTQQTIVVQCKHTTTARNVQSRVIQQVNGTAGPAHHADVAVVVTNGGFTRDAQAAAHQWRIALIDRDHLARWAGQGAGLDDMLKLHSRVRGRRFQLRHRHEI